MRADRLVATLLILQRRGRVTARALADELEVSVATARRDLEALSSAGIPVYPTRGRGGGWELVGGYRTDLTGLSEPDVRAVFTRLGGRDDDTTRAAVRKLLEAVPEPLRPRADAAARRTVVDVRPWGRAARPHPEHLAAVMDAMVEGRRVDLAYRPWDRDVRTMTVDPLGVVEKAGVWYVLARTDDGMRTLRVDRIHAVSGTGAMVDPVDEVDVRAYWFREEERIARRHRVASARVRGPHDEIARLARDLGADGVRIDGSDGPAAAPPTRGCVDATVWAESDDRLAAVLLAVAGSVDVVGPESVRERMTALAHAALRRLG